MTWGAIVVGALLGPLTNLLQERKFKRVTEANGGILVPESRLELACVAGVGAFFLFSTFLREKQHPHFASCRSLPNLPLLVRLDVVSIRTLARACRCACPVRSSFSSFLSPSFASLTTFSRSQGWSFFSLILMVNQMCTDAYGGALLAFFFPPSFSPITPSELTKLPLPRRIRRKRTRCRLSRSQPRRGRFPSVRVFLSPFLSFHIFTFSRHFRLSLSLADPPSLTQLRCPNVQPPRLPMGVLPTRFPRAPRHADSLPSPSVWETDQEEESVCEADYGEEWGGY
jgi:hypothetical protein